uniref:DUF6754 domain-containing protein n=1 Tax=candidate division WOR-3 bacterium TaxID=2052148 RepID=A0A7C4GA70_UNCW3
MMTLWILTALTVVGLTPPGSVTARDAPNDQGGQIVIRWDDIDDAANSTIALFRSTCPDTGFIEIAAEPVSSTEYTDAEVADGCSYYYRLVVRSDGDSAVAPVVGPVRSSAQWFNSGRSSVLIVFALICAAFLFYIFRARRGTKMFVRRIAGLDAIDDALGRATEMGKPILFSFGLGVITDLVVIAALPLLRKVARKAADYAIRLIVPNADPIVMTAAQETVKEAYLESGRPDLYNPDNITFLTSDQFGYAAGVDGIILREKPGAIFWLGYFYAESLVMAETGHSVGAIQLAGTTETTQLPFFVAACDYTMIGEEIFAASCYLKPEPVMLGTLKGEDFLKLVLVICITALVVLGTAGAITGNGGAALTRIHQAVSTWLTPAS